MTITITNQPPGLSDLIQILRSKYADRYAIEMFELGQPSIIVKKSFWTGAQITIRKKEIELDFTYPNLISGILGATLVYIDPFSSVTHSWHKLERELRSFLKKKYGCQ